MKWHRFLLTTALLAAFTLALPPTRAATPVPNATNTTANTPKPTTFDAYTKSEITASLDTLQSAADPDPSVQRLDNLFDQIIAREPAKQMDLFREADFARRLATQMAELPADQRTSLLKYLPHNPTLAHTLVFLIHGKDSPVSIYNLLATLKASRGEQLEKFANLTAALCVVHDRPLTQRLNENEATAPDPLAIFDYFTKNENAMAFGIRNVPAELLIWVVDTTATIEDMQWALNKYAHNNLVGQLFFTIQYDYASFRTGSEKKVTTAGYSLPNILKYGGVCVDQAYFATAVGKAIGVPTAFTTGKSAEVGHAWVGFLQAQGRAGWWNFDIGRYEEYRGIRGSVMDPQSREMIPDSYVSLTGELIGKTAAERQNAAALSDAAARLIALSQNGKDLTLADLPANITNAPRPIRKATTEAELDLLQTALDTNVANVSAWAALEALTADGKLSWDQKQKWGRTIILKCGTRYPDFALSALAPMYETVEDPQKQDQLWQEAFNVFKNRADLAAAILMAEAHLWEEQKNTAEAGKRYTQVINSYVNAGPFVLGALKGAEKLLRDSGKSDRVVTLYAQTWKQCQKPEDMAGEFMTQSNWYRIGRLLEQQLKDANQPQQAAAVAAQIDGVVGGKQ